MLSAIGSSTYASPAVVGKPAAGLETQLEQYKVQLADWVSCPSCKTPEGKAKIAELTDKISEIKQSLKAADAAKKSNRPTGTDAPSDQAKTATVAAAKSGADAASAVRSPGGTIGSRLDVFA